MRVVRELSAQAENNNNNIAERGGARETASCGRNALRSPLPPPRA